MTGFEVAGIVLAVYPIVLQGLGYYRDVAQYVKDVRNYQGVLKRLVRQLEMEKSKFENICSSLLEGLVTAEDIDEFLGDAKRWEDDKFQHELLKYLRPNAAKSFTDGVAELQLSLKNLEKDIGLDKKREVG